jgi:ribose 1,5-bisphosphokinase PhnN
MTEFTSLVIVGPSASGKDTLVQGLKADPYFEDKLFYPKRYTTRFLGEGEDSSVHEHMDLEEFEVAVGFGKLWPHWKRKLDIGEDRENSIWYGFDDVRHVPEAAGRLALYVATNDFLSSSEESVVEVRESAYFVMASVENEERRKRLQASSRWREMSRKEQQARYNENGIVDVAGVHFQSIPTGGAKEESAAVFQAIVKRLIRYNERTREGLFVNVSELYM